MLSSLWQEQASGSSHAPGSTAHTLASILSLDPNLLASQPGGAASSANSPAATALAEQLAELGSVGLGGLGSPLGSVGGGSLAGGMGAAAGGGVPGTPIPGRGVLHRTTSAPATQHQQPLSPGQLGSPYSPYGGSSMAGTPTRGLLRTSSLNAKKAAPNRVCCNALLAAYARAQPPQVTACPLILDVFFGCFGDVGFP